MSHVRAYRISPPHRNGTRTVTDRSGNPLGTINLYGPETWAGILTSGTQLPLTHGMQAAARNIWAATQRNTP